MNRIATRWRGKLPIPQHVHPLVRRFFCELNSQQTTLTEVAQRAGIQRATMSDWRYSRCPTIANFNAALNVIGMELKIGPIRD